MCIDSLAKSLSIDRNDKTQCKQFAKYKEHNVQNMKEMIMVMFLSSDSDLG